MSPTSEPPNAPDLPGASVVIVARNCSDALRRCLTALDGARPFADLDVVVVDANSTDGSAHLDSEFPNVNLLRMPKNFGKTRARNIGIRTATRELILLLGPDVEVAPQTPASLIQVLEERHDLSAASALLTGETGEPVPMVYPIPDPAAFRTILETGRLPLTVSAGSDAPAVLDQALLVRRSFLAGMNYFDERRYAEWWADLELFAQIRHAQKKVAVVSTAPAVYRPVSEPVRSASERALLRADQVNGAAAFLSKHYGAGAGFSLKLGSIFSALGGMLSFRDFSYQSSLLGDLLFGARMDGGA